MLQSEIRWRCHCAASRGTKKCTFILISFLQSYVLVEHKKENALCLQHDRSSWRKLWFARMGFGSGLAAGGTGRVLLSPVGRWRFFPPPVRKPRGIWRSLYPLYGLQQENSWSSASVNLTLCCGCFCVWHDRPVAPCASWPWILWEAGKKFPFLPGNKLNGVWKPGGASVPGSQECFRRWNRFPFGDLKVRALGSRLRIFHCNPRYL